MTERISKDEAEYSRGMLHSHCGPTFRDDKYHCKHFIHGPGFYGQCEKVRGTIEPIMWCRLFEKVRP